MKPLRLLLLNDEWFSRRGGISTFNRDFCIALAKAGHDVSCYVQSADDNAVSHAASHKVRLICAENIPGLKPCCRLCLKPSVDAEPDVIIGHDHITGGALHALGDQFFQLAKKVFVVHVAPDDIEWYKKKEGSAARAEEKVNAQVACASRADLIVTVGPRLFRAIEGGMVGSGAKHVKLHQLDPGCKKGLEGKREVITEIQIFLLGRVEDFELKGVDVAVRAFAKYRDSVDARQKDASVLVIRGVEPGKEDELRKKIDALKTGVPARCIRVREYSADEEDLRSHLRQASVMLMPSRVEGFGLVGLEAIGAAVPVLVDASSGLGEVLSEKLESHSDSMIIRETKTDEEGAAAWADRIVSIVNDRVEANRKAEVNFERVVRVLNWESAVKEFEEALSGILPAEAKAPQGKSTKRTK